MMVLDGAINPERFMHIVLHIIKLCQGKFFDKTAPVFALIIGDTDTTIMCGQDIVGVIRIDPHAVLIGMDFSLDGFKMWRHHRWRH